MPKILKTKIKDNKKEYPIYLKFLFTILKSLLLTFILFVLLGIVFYNNPQFTLFYGITLYFIISLGGFSSGYFLYKYLNGRGIVNGLAGGTIYGVCLSLYLMIAVSFNYSINILFVLAFSILSGALGGIFGANKK